MSLWNVIGLLAWALVLGYLVFIVINIRRRHLRALVETQRVSGGVIGVDLVEVAVLVLVFVGMAWVTWLRPVSFVDRHEVGNRYSYRRLMLQTSATPAYYVTVTSGNGKQPVRYYTYWTDGAKYEITSRNADVSDQASPMTVRASAFPWQTKKLTEWDKAAEKAYVATYTATYKGNFLNGLGMRVGHVAQRFSIIRIPNETFQKVEAVSED